MGTFKVNIEGIQKAYSEASIQQYIEKHHLAVLKLDEMKFEYMLRHQVTPVIKGAITPGKIKWRGISIARNQMGEFLGVTQRGKLINLDLHNFVSKLEMEDVMLFGGLPYVEELHRGIINQINKIQ